MKLSTLEIQIVGLHVGITTIMNEHIRNLYDACSGAENKTLRQASRALPRKIEIFSSTIFYLYFKNYSHFVFRFIMLHTVHQNDSINNNKFNIT